MVWLGSGMKIMRVKEKNVRGQTKSRIRPSIWGHCWETMLEAAAASVNVGKLGSPGFSSTVVWLVVVFF